ncbi:hypothetical protein FYZ43_00730 [Mobiluncus mulieris]|uniref:Uncharacterized protein n=1 Tax=Mobiluncus mulieris TaxID=2052 RepID=A0ABD4TST0_9ACTO|nr:hypothetical protein [Mobiluncus mulieris]MCU9972885.1 hypothetical protein [Mobiluncus mulieris]
MGDLAARGCGAAPAAPHPVWVGWVGLEADPTNPQKASISKLRIALTESAPTLFGVGFRR